MQLPRELAVGSHAYQMPTIADRDLTSPTNALTDGTAYIVGASATGLWAGQDGKIAYYDQEWRFVTPRNGFGVLVDDENEFIVYMDSAWIRMQDAINPPVVITAATALTNQLHNRRTLVSTNTTGVAITLPAATGSGDVYEINFGATIASGSQTIVVTGNDTFFGLALGLDGDGVPANAWSPVAGDNRMTLDGSTRGGVKGDKIILTDLAADVWGVQARLQQSGTEATPFSTV